MEPACISSTSSPAAQNDILMTVGATASGRHSLSMYAGPAGKSKSDGTFGRVEHLQHPGDRHGSTALTLGRMQARISASAVV
eukprot:COSAG02_NODE_52052_length_310_cov_0.800948_1_plen_81_part_10